MTCNEEMPLLMSCKEDMLREDEDGGEDEWTAPARTQEPHTEDVGN